MTNVPRIIVASWTLMGAAAFTLLVGLIADSKLVMCVSILIFWIAILFIICRIGQVAFNKLPAGEVSQKIGSTRLRQQLMALPEADLERLVIVAMQTLSVEQWREEIADIQGIESGELSNWSDRVVFQNLSRAL